MFFFKNELSRWPFEQNALMVDQTAWMLEILLGIVACILNLHTLRLCLGYKDLVAEKDKEREKLMNVIVQI